MINLIAALNTKRVIGKDDELPWRIPADLARFKKLTLSCPVIMGRKTWESLPSAFRPLKGRRNIVVTRNPNYEAEGALVVDSIEKALEAARAEHANDVWVIGGGEIYSLALPYADQLILTFVHDDSDDPSWAHFPPFEEFSEIVPNDPSESGLHEENGLRYEFVTLRRPSSTP